MTTEAIALRFELVADECCSLCNPVRLADYEQPCVRVRRHDCPQAAFHFCLSCVDLLVRGGRGEPSIRVLPLEVSRFMRELLRQCSPDEPIH